jgi:hypothetical protein
MSDMLCCGNNNGKFQENLRVELVWNTYNTIYSHTPVYTFSWYIKITVVRPKRIRFGRLCQRHVCGKRCTTWFLKISFVSFRVVKWKQICRSLMTKSVSGRIKRSRMNLFCKK